MKKLILFLSLLLLGCGSSVTPVYDEKGNKHISIGCDGALITCQQKANEVCPKGYKLVGKDIQNNGALGFANANTAILTQGNSFYMTIDCKD